MCSTSPTCDSAHIPSHLPFASPYLQNSAGVWRQQILNSILRKSKLGGEEIQPVTISVSMAFRGLAPLSPWKKISARHWHFLCRLIGIHHHHATFLHHHKDFQYCHCYKGVILAHYQHDLQHCLITLMLFFQSQTLTIWSCWVPTWQRKGITDKQSNIMIEFRWWRWWIWWCNDLPWKGVEYNRKMNIKAHRLSPAQPTSMKLDPRTFAL